jgi:citrate lyase subunit beta/citryl-CoA lyase
MTWAPPGPALLFCPADRPERYAKAAACADLVILDLEDGVAPAARPAARLALGDTPLDPDRVAVRINATGGADQALDLEALKTTPYRLIMLPKAESPTQVSVLAPYQVIALCETPAGVLAAAQLASTPATVALMWGAEDLVAAIGGHSSRRGDGTYRDVARHARSQVLLAAAAHGVAAIDTVHLEIADLDGLAEEASDGAASGFAATACIHPAQVPVVRAAYQPAPEDVAWAQRVLSASRGERGVFAFEGRMVDAPILRHAEHIERLTADPLRAIAGTDQEGS